METTTTTTTSSTSTSANVVGNETNIILSSTAEQSVISCGKSDNVSLLVSLKAPYFEETYRAPIDLVTVIDRSGSMGGLKIELVKETLKFIVRQLKSKDKMSIVIYDHDVEIVYPLTEMDLSAKEKANRAITQICSRGSTDLCAGLLTGIDVINKRESKNDVASVLLFTDGLANAGIQNADGIVAEMTKKASPPTETSPLGSLPCSVHTFGFGSDHDVNILKAIADRGSGTYFFVENKDTIADAFADCLGGLLSVVAQNISLEVEGINGTIVDMVKTAYPTVNQHSRYTIAIGDIQSEEERDVLLIVTVPEYVQQIDQSSIIRAKLSYFNVITSKQEETTCQCVVSRNNDLTPCVYNLKVDCQRNRLFAADALSEAKKKGDAGDYKGARDAIDRVREIIRKSKTSNDPFVVALLQDLDQSYSGLHDRESYTTYGGYTVTSKTSAHCQQRATHTTQAYQTMARGTLKSKIDI
eukprot:TRINITY_DN409_c0_g1_i3.p1 TRINITY_DN409_c0_g1~~TRINITY_DN409_c0_g1_i3.p1  ORF type:complete len:471 (+),score=75.26 TRINITY_DN409_c0_g1_i3:63-1475(+)